MIHRLGKLWMVNGWTEENAVLLAEWVADEYKFEPMGLIESVLKNPPITKDRHGDDEKNWKLNPDTIRRWMAEAMESQAAKREAEHQRAKDSFNDPLPVVKVASEAEYKEHYTKFYSGFIQRQEDGTALREVKSDPWLKGDDGFSKFKAQRMKKEMEQQPKENDGPAIQGPGV